MQNKFLKSLALIALMGLVLQAPAMAQTTDPVVKSENKDQLDQRNQKSIEKPTPGNHEKVNDRVRTRQSGKQNFRNRSSWRGHWGDFGPRQYEYYHRGFKRYGHKFYNPNFRFHPLRQNSLRGENFRSHDFNSRGFKGQHHKTRGFRENPGPLKRSQYPEIKSMREQIWKDGVMDLKERDLMRNKMKEFYSLNSPLIQDRKKEHSRKESFKKK